MDIELKIKGEVTCMRLQPGDKIIVTVRKSIPFSTADEIKAQVRRIFPDHEVLVASGGVTLGVASAPEAA